MMVDFVLSAAMMYSWRWPAVCIHKVHQLCWQWYSTSCQEWQWRLWRLPKCSENCLFDGRNKADSILCTNGTATCLYKTWPNVEVSIYSEACYGVAAFNTCLYCWVWGCNTARQQQIMIVLLYQAVTDLHVFQDPASLYECLICSCSNESFLNAAGFSLFFSASTLACHWQYDSIIISFG